MCVPAPAEPTIKQNQHFVRIELMRPIVPTNTEPNHLLQR